MVEKLVWSHKHNNSSLPLSCVYDRFIPEIRDEPFYGGAVNDHGIHSKGARPHRYNLPVNIFNPRQKTLRGLISPKETPSLIRGASVPVHVGNDVVDTRTPEQRSRNMAAIKSRDTRPEIAVRRLLHSLGFRFRLHRNDLPGRPDIVLSKYRTVIFVNGCFWHQHSGCVRATMPQSRQYYWRAKLERNVERDRENISKLKRDGWNVIVVWECNCSHINELGHWLTARVTGNTAIQTAKVSFGTSAEKAL